jgi:hypothetical protein
MSTEKVPKVPKFYTCDVCDYNACRKSQYDRHLLTAKHIKSTETQKISTKSSEKISDDFQCCCGRRYKERTGLWKHKKKCEFSLNKNKNIEIEEKKTKIKPEDIYCEKQMLVIENKETRLEAKIDHEELIKELMKQNNEFKSMLIDQNNKIMELAKEGKYITNNNTNNTTNNNHFNLNFFLNEKCKDALNIMDFINQLKLKLSDLDMVGRVGYTEGISKIFIRGLKELDLFKRPVHCSDLKREVLYVKDKDSWEKDTDEKNKMKTAIKYIAAKNFKQIGEWQEENPDSDDYESKKHMEYHQIIINSMGGSTVEEDDKHFNKIIRNVAQEVVIDKTVT